MYLPSYLFILDIGIMYSLSNLNFPKSMTIMLSLYVDMTLPHDVPSPVFARIPNSDIVSQLTSKSHRLASSPNSLVPLLFWILLLLSVVCDDWDLSFAAIEFYVITFEFLGIYPLRLKKSILLSNSPRLVQIHRRRLPIANTT